MRSLINSETDEPFSVEALWIVPKMFCQIGCVSPYSWGTYIKMSLRICCSKSDNLSREWGSDSCSGEKREPKVAVWELFFLGAVYDLSSVGRWQTQQRLWRQGSTLCECIDLIWDALTSCWCSILILAFVLWARWINSRTNAVRGDISVLGCISLCQLPVP